MAVVTEGVMGDDTESILEEAETALREGKRIYDLSLIHI